MNSLSWLKKASWILPFLILASCQGLRTREDVRRPPTPTRPSAPGQQTPSSPSQVITQDEDDHTVVTEPPPPAPVIPDMPKIGIILGAGGAKTFAHIGFLHELMRAKVPVHIIGGVEFAAPMAALYANKEQANDVEWQMFKLKDEDIIKKSLLGSVSKNGEVSQLKDFIGTAFSRAKVDEFSIPFACPSYNLKKNQVYLMNRGSLDQLMYMCMAYPPFFRPHQGNVAAVRDISALANYMRSKGANHIVLINVLQAPGGNRPYTSDAAATDNVLWSEIAGLYNKPLAGVDTVVSLDTSAYGIMDFEKRREIMNKGAEAASRQMKTLTRRWGL
ncbi:MAG: patatin-like phospholipase family protein [Bdellovibrio sp.]